MKVQLFLVGALLSAALLVSGCAGGPSPAPTPAATQAPPPPAAAVSADDARSLDSLLQNTTSLDSLNVPDLPDLSL